MIRHAYHLRKIISRQSFYPYQLNIFSYDEKWQRINFCQCIINPVRHSDSLDTVFAIGILYIDEYCPI